MNAKVTLHPSSPTEQVIAKSMATYDVKDARGRTIKIRKPTALAQLRLVEALGETAANQTYVGMCLPLTYVVSVDAIDVEQPATKREVEALYQTLDDDGITAVIAGIKEHGLVSDPEADKKALKK